MVFTWKNSQNNRLSGWNPRKSVQYATMASRTPLHVAVWSGSIHIVDLLLHSADYNKADLYGRTTRFFGAFFGRFLEHQNLPMLKFLTDSRCLRMTLHLLCFTWFYYSKSTSSQVFGKKHPLLNVKETLPLCLWMNEPCSSFTTNQSSFLFSSSWSGGLFLGNLHLHDFFRLKCQTWLEVQMVHYGYGLSFFLTLKSWTHQDFEP